MKSMRFICLFFSYCLIALSPLLALDTTESKKKTICLNMIVKDESGIITRCLASTLPIIDYWVIVDTGSTDGTQDIIRNYMKEHNIAGELHERPWVNFAHNRNEALDLAKGKADYLLLIDADEYFDYASDFQLPSLEKDFYYITVHLAGTAFSRIELLNNALDWKYAGVLHEALDPGNRSFEVLEKIRNISTRDGARSRDPKKYEKDAEILTKALEHDPGSSRNMFYLARSYHDAGQLDKALEHYEKRTKMIGWAEETFWAYLQIAVLQDALNMPTEMVINSYKRAFQERPSRVEPLYYLSQYYHRQKNYEAAYEVIRLALSVPTSKDHLFVQQWMYDYGLQLEHSVSTYWLGQYKKCEQLCFELLGKSDLPNTIREVVNRNLGFAQSKILEQICNTNQAVTQSDEELLNAKGVTAR